MKQKLFTKYFLATGTLVVCSLTVIMMIMTVVYYQYISETKYESLQTSCDTISSFYKENRNSISGFESQKGIYYIMKNLSDVSDYDLFITDNYGVVKICSCEDWLNTGHCHHTEKMVDKRYFSGALKEKKGEITSLGVYKEPHYVSSSPITAVDGSLIGMVIAASPITGLKSMFSSIGKIYLLSAIIPLCIMFVALYIITYKLTRPLKLMSVAAKSMANGDFSKRIPVTSDDEIGELAVSFNQMTNSLSRLENMRKSFVADVSHELKTPMTTIGGFIDGIIDGTIEPEKEKHYLSLVSEEIKRLSRMVESMLSISRIESDEFKLKPENFDFKELLLSIVLSQEQRIEAKNIDIIGLDGVMSISVFADKDLIYRVVYNLIDNAIKFTEINGRISFAVKNSSEKLEFSVTNSGIGIKSADIPYVFERFYKTDKSRSENKNSTGLGLYIVKTIINKHGGKIWVSSTENEKTTFAFTLPKNDRR
ncbi:MAG: HAMP domain-containing histidine kinase [Clostridia bacterium]|nr:HAMP domain-containing histidine kinase [Clostridia bacterium]